MLEIVLSRGDQKGSGLIKYWLLRILLSEFISVHFVLETEIWEPLPSVRRGLFVRKMVRLVRELLS